jgi:hypothetical protein
LFAASISSAENFSGKDLPARATGSVNDPAHAKGKPARNRDFHRHLIGSTTDTARADFHDGTDIAQRLIEYFDRVAASSLLD